MAAATSRGASPVEITDLECEGRAHCDIHAAQLQEPSKGEIPCADTPLEHTSNDSTSCTLAKSFESAVKLFVGCLPKTADEAAVTEVFSDYGTVVDAHILRDNNANTKFSAFVYFETMDMALNAIRHLDRHYTMPNGKRPMEVRLAEKKGLRVPRSKAVPSKPTWKHVNTCNSNNIKEAAGGVEYYKGCHMNWLNTSTHPTYYNTALPLCFEKGNHAVHLEGTNFLRNMEWIEYHE